MNGQTIITVVLADDHAGVRGAIRSLLEGAALLRVTGEATDGAAAVRLAQELAPDLVLMDVGMPELTGIEAARLIVSLTRSRVIMLSLQCERQVVLESLRVGAVGYVLKQHAARELLRAIGCVMAGGRYLSHACEDPLELATGLGATWVEKLGEGAEISVQAIKGDEGAQRADATVFVVPPGGERLGGA